MSANLGFAFSAAWQVLLVGLVLGAGLPMVFALGVRSMALGSGGSTGVGDHTPHPAARLLAGVCFAVVIAGVLLALLYIVVSGQGKELSFSHVFPTVVAKS